MFQHDAWTALVERCTRPAKTTGPNEPWVPVLFGWVTGAGSLTSDAAQKYYITDEISSKLYLVGADRSTTLVLQQLRQGELQQLLVPSLVEHSWCIHIALL